ncbi:MAG TPA: hypothetical protein VHB77_03960 [Planctomycetaceae bacterium]|nr:hypothetical protein [Planctomycetaceae bacterium]
MGPCRLPWMGRPLWASLLGLLVLLVAVTVCASIYCRERLAAIAYVERSGGNVSLSRAPGWCPRWKPVLVLVQSVEQVELIAQSSDDFDRIRPLAETRWLTLRGARADDALLAGINRLQRLENLYFRDSEVTDTGMSHLRDCRRLHTLDLTGTKITDAGLKPLAGLPIDGLCLNGLAITDCGLKYLKGLPLQTLFLGQTRVSDDGLRELSGMPLTYMSLSHTGISDAGLKHLAGVPLREFDLQGTAINDVGIAEVARWPLERLHLRDTQISPSALPALNGMKTLHYLELSNPPITRADISAFSWPNVDVTLD